MQREQKITLGEMRSAGGPCLLLVYCGDYKCAHSVVVHARWGDDVRLSDLEPKFIVGLAVSLALMSNRCLSGRRTEGR
jgi:hypothetical protein